MRVAANRSSATRLAVVKRNILKRARIHIEAEADMVIMRLGNVEYRMPYDDALLLSQWVRVRAKQAKRFAGDRGTHWSVVGTLHDANYGPDVTRG